MLDLVSILVATGLVSLLALVGILTVAVNEDKLERFLMLLVGLATGALMGGAWLHLLPEAVEGELGSQALTVALVAFIGFFLIEKGLRWRHCHKSKCTDHLGQMNLIGDSVHNFIDGLIIAAAFGVSSKLGWITTLAIGLHEIPQEIGDFGVLLYAGWKKSKALVYNFAAALTVVLGGLVGWWLKDLEGVVSSLLPIAAGGFVYIAAADLIPELKKETSLVKSLGSLVVFLLGVGLMWGLKWLKIG